MTDLFRREDVLTLLRGKTLLILGASIQRGLYKDIIWLMNSNTLINRGVLGDKGEARCPNFESERVSFKNEKEKKKLEKIFHDANRDHLHWCGSCEDDFKGLHSTRNYTEVREYYNEENDIMVIFKFINRVSPSGQQNWTDSICLRLRRQLDIVLVNSGLWDVNRAGPFAHLDFRTSLDELTAAIKQSVPSGLCFWLTTPPISEVTNSKGMMVSGLEQQNFLTQYNVHCVNKIASVKFRNEVLNVIDLHHFLLPYIAKRNPDGIHWNPEANRMMTNKILTHLCLAMNQNLPGRINSPALDRLKIDQRQRENFERNLVKKNGDIRDTMRFCRRDKVISVSEQVKKLWWNIRERAKANFGDHCLRMSCRVALRQQVNKLELPPLGFINRTLPRHGDRPLERNFGESESLSRPHFSNPGPMNQPRLEDRPLERNFGESESLSQPYYPNPGPMNEPRVFENLNVFNGNQSQMLHSDQQPQGWTHGEFRLDRPSKLNFRERESLSRPNNINPPGPMHQQLQPRVFENLNVFNRGQSQIMQSDQQPQVWCPEEVTNRLGPNNSTFLNPGFESNDPHNQIWSTEENYQNNTNTFNSNIPDRPPAMMHNSIGYQNPNRAFPNFSQQENHIGLQNSLGISMMSQSGGHGRGYLSNNQDRRGRRGHGMGPLSNNQNRRGRSRRAKSYEKAGGRKNPY